MLKTIAGAAAAVALVGFASTPAFAGAQDFNLKNETGETITKVFISAVEKNDWEENVLGEDKLEEGASVDIKFAHSETDCHWDMKVEFEDGSSAEWPNFHLCEINAIDIKYDKASNTATAEYE
jgi:hypothetical protein